MIHFPASIDNLPDEELLSLQKELEESGVLDYDKWEYDEDSWDFQAYERWEGILAEMRRRHPQPYRGLISEEELRRLSLEMLQNTLVATRELNREYDREFR